MATGYVSYAVDFEGVEFVSPIEIYRDGQPVEKIEIQTEEGGRLIVKFSIKDVFTPAEATAVASKLIEPLIDQIVYEFDCFSGGGEMYRYNSSD